jgi:hypothetical protein
VSYEHLPAIRRARDYHLYAQNGKRYLDMYLGAGRALFGHKPPGLQRILKNEMQKGLLAEFPSRREKRLEKALLSLAGNGFQFRIYAGVERALAAAGGLLGRSLKEKDIAEPFFGPVAGAPVYLRPLADMDYSRFSLLLPLLPFPGSFAPQPLLFRDAPPPPESDAISPLLLAGLIRVIELQTGDKSPDIWKEWRLPGWKRFGCYCFREDGGQKNYRRVFERFLAEGLVISPVPERPTLLPRIFSQGEQRLIERLSSETAFGSDI